MTKGFIHKIAVLCKDYYVIRTINDLFIFAGAEYAWRKASAEEAGSARMDEVYKWVEGIKEHAPDQLEKILTGVATQIAENERIPEGDRTFIKGHLSPSNTESYSLPAAIPRQPEFPKDVEQLLERLIRGLPRAMLPLKHRRKDLPFLNFDNEYDVQSLFHSLLRPWINDIRSEEYTPSYAGTSTRIDFLCPKHGIVIEIKFIRDAKHAKSVGDELIIDISHYRAHPSCAQLWIVAFDPHGLVPNTDGLKTDLDGEHSNKHGSLKVRTFVLTL